MLGFKRLMTSCESVAAQGMERPTETQERRAGGVPYRGTETGETEVGRSWKRPSQASLRNLVFIRREAMAPHFSTLAWKIPWMEEPGGLQSMGSLRVGHD